MRRCSCCSVAVTADATGWVAPVAVSELYESLRIPSTNVSMYLNRLRGQGLAVQRGGDRLWSITPEGREAVRGHLADLDHQQLEAEMAGLGGAEYLRTLNPVIDPAMAPPRWATGIARLHDRFPFETNIFCMTRFPAPGATGLPDPVGSTITLLREASREHGMTMHVAWDRQVEDTLFGNVGAYMWGSRYGIGIVEDRAGRGLNHNVMIEVGSMLILGRRCTMLKDRTAPDMPSDLGAEIFKPVDLDDADAVGDEAHRWLSEDLGLGRCAHCPTAPM